MKSFIRILTLLIIFLVVTSEQCQDKKLAEELLPGYKLYDAPNDLDRTGLIFRVTPDGERFNVGYLEVKPETGRIEIKSTAQTKTLTIGAIAKFLNIDQKDINLGADVDLKRKVVLLMKMSNTNSELVSLFSSLKTL